MTLLSTVISVLLVVPWLVLILAPPFALLMAGLFVAFRTVAAIEESGWDSRRTPGARKAVAAR